MLRHPAVEQRSERRLRPSDLQSVSLSLQLGEELVGLPFRGTLRLDVARLRDPDRIGEHDALARDSIYPRGDAHLKQRTHPSDAAAPPAVACGHACQINTDCG